MRVFQVVIQLIVVAEGSVDFEKLQASIQDRASGLEGVYNVDSEVDLTLIEVILTDTLSINYKPIENYTDLNED